MTLRDARKEKRFSQTELASLVGCTQAALSLIERYKVTPHRETKTRLRKVLGDVEFYPTRVLVESVQCFITCGDRRKTKERAAFLKAEIDKAVECVLLNIRNFKLMKK